MMRNSSLYVSHTSPKVVILAKAEIHKIVLSKTIIFIKFKLL